MNLGLDKLTGTSIEMRLVPSIVMLLVPTVYVNIMILRRQ